MNLELGFMGFSLEPFTYDAAEINAHTNLCDRLCMGLVSKLFCFPERKDLASLVRHVLKESNATERQFHERAPNTGIAIHFEKKDPKK